MAPLIAAVVASLGLKLLAQSVVRRVAVITLQEIGKKLGSPAFDAAVVEIAAALAVPIAKAPAGQIEPPAA